MSENLNRSTPDFSKYDSMSIGELEEILRADALGPERADSDVDEILYVMEVLAKKRRENGTAGKTALEAYQEFQQHYLPMAEEGSKPRRKSNVIPFRRIAAVAACLVLVFTLSTTAHAFSFRDVWEAVVTWAQETFYFSTGVEVSEPKADSELKFESAQAFFIENNIPLDIIPTKCPDRYTFSDVFVTETPKREEYLAVFYSDNDTLKISIKVFLEDHPEQIEMNNGYHEIYSSNGIDYHLIVNHDQLQAVWITNTYECYISGVLTIDEAKEMIDSIEKGS